jgi:hypothetical protein
MEAVLSIIGAIWVVLGSFSVLYTDRFRNGVGGLTSRIPPRVLAVVPLVMGVLLMISAPASHSFWLVEILGILALVKGLLIFGLRRKWVQGIFAWWQRRVSEVAWRLCGLILVILGVFVVLKV